MKSLYKLRKLVAATISVGAMLLAGAAFASSFNIPGGELEPALNAYTAQSGVQLVVSNEAIKGIRTKGVKGELSADGALLRILKGTGFAYSRDAAGVIEITRDKAAANDIPSEELLSRHVAAASVPAASGASLETVTVTSSKIGGDVQNIPISITALSQEQLTSTQTAGGPDLIKQVPNMTFTKTNFSGYSIQLRGVGTQAISVTTDPAVAVAFNDTPFIRNHFFEQEFYDVSQVEVLRGPQGTLYGRNATAGVVNLTSAQPTDQFEAMASVDIGNYQSRRLEGMINVPIVDDRFDLRVAGEWTKRQGYSFNESDGDRIDGRDLWSGRATLAFKPTPDIHVDFIWEHFSEDDNRLRSAKQLCKTDYGPGEINGVPKPVGPSAYGQGYSGDYFSQGCIPASFYSPDAYHTPLAYILPYVLGALTLGDANNIPYNGVDQSTNLRVIESGLNPNYSAKNDVLELNGDYEITPTLTFFSQTGFDHDFLYSTEDFNRFGSNPGFFVPGIKDGGVSDQGVFCDPQLGCSNRLIAEDLSTEHAWQLSQEFRVSSNFSGPINFSAGGNYLHYETLEKYYVFSNAFTIITVETNPQNPWIPGVSDNKWALPYGFSYNPLSQIPHICCDYIDPNPLTHLNDNGHNYFLSQNPYVLNSYAAFGEANYNVFSDLKLTAGVRWTEDRKHFVQIPSWLITWGWGYPIAGVVDQQWDKLTGRAVANWTPKLSFTDQTLVYGSYAHGYKAGGANPPGAIFTDTASFYNGQLTNTNPTHPLTFKPEFVDAFEVGTKNTLLDGSLTLNGDLFYYNYENYQISQIVDRTAVNLNFDAHVKGAELEATWEPVPGLRFNFAGGWEDTAIAKGQSAVDLMDRTAGHPGWYILKPFVTEASDCIFPAYVAQYINLGSPTVPGASFCDYAYQQHLDPITLLPYVKDPTTFNPGPPQGLLPPGYAGFDPTTVPNDGTGFSKDLSGNQLPNAPPYTVSFGAQYTLPLTTDWAGTLRSDVYWQADSWWRVFNDLSYDKLHGYANLNLTLIFTNQNGWQVMLYDKNVFNTTAITGAFLNSDDSGLTTNVFLTDPKLIGVRVTKNW